jgi:hypothetical protein
MCGVRGGLPAGGLPAGCWCSLVEDFGRGVRAIGPGDRPGFGVYSYLREGTGVAQGREHAAPVTQIGLAVVADQAVGERQPEPVVAEDLRRR